MVQRENMASLSGMPGVVMTKNSSLVVTVLEALNFAPTLDQSCFACQHFFHSFLL